jgi:isoaspartyl peptidase/L-asparaginase-like protein (Ntn-hydrolase superfamily)
VDARFAGKPTPMNRLDKDVPHLPMADANASPEEVRSWALEEKYSTVGCVVKDRYGNLASAGSTGDLLAHF